MPLFCAPSFSKRWKFCGKMEKFVLKLFGIIAIHFAGNAASAPQTCPNGVRFHPTNLNSEEAKNFKPYSTIKVASVQECASICASLKFCSSALFKKSNHACDVSGFTEINCAKCNDDPSNAPEITKNGSTKKSTTKPEETASDSADKRSVITMDDLLNRNFSGEYISAYWVGSDQLLVKNDSLFLVSINGSEVTTSLFMNSSIFTNVSGPNLYVSPDRKYIAFTHNSTKLYRYSSNFHVTLIDVEDAKNRNYSIGPSENGTEKLQAFVWNPKIASNDFVFVSGNNIYYQASPDGGPRQITFSGDTERYIYNGLTDWIYEEEIILSDKALWWSDDGEYLAYVEFNDSAVPLQKYPLYPDNQLYPTIKEIPYSKVGEVLPTLKLMVWSKSGADRPVELKPPTVVEKLGEYYLYSARFTTEKFDANSLSLVAVWTNRQQNHTFTSVCRLEFARCYLVSEQPYRHNGMEMYAEPWFSTIRFSTNEEYYAIGPRKSGSNVFNGIQVVSVMDDKSRFLNTGSYDVTSIVGHNAQKKEIYFIAGAPLPKHRQLYKVSTVKNGKRAKCVTCSLINTEDCGYVTASFNRPGYDNYILNCYGPGVPKVFLRKISTEKTLMRLNDNAKLAAYVEKKAVPVNFYTTISMPNGFDTIVKLEMPPGTNLNTTEKLPMILRVYGGPGFQEVLSLYRIGFDQYLTSNKRYVTARIDGRGSGARGWKYKSPVMYKLGTVEIEDQISAAKIIADKFDFVDKSKIAVWGWSYGGATTAHILIEDKDTFFKCGASVAMVTDNELYDAAYTERYMGLPSFNKKGYEHTQISRNATSFKDRNYLLVHASDDDNVHVQNTHVFVKALTKANVQFKLMIYTDENHSILGTKKHLWTMLENHFSDCFGKSS